MPNAELNNFVNKFKNLLTECELNATEWISEDDKKKFLTINKQQLWDGKNVFDNNIRPYYSENPYFETPQQAQAYINWKAKVTPNPNRFKDAPNLYINGYFYNTLEVEVKKESFKIKSDDTLGIKITSVHKNVLGLNEKNKEEIKKNDMIPFFIKFVENYLKT
jgi:hypothetical protein